MAYHAERFRRGDDNAGKDDPGTDAAMLVYSQRHTELRYDVHADQVVVSQRVAVLLRHAREVVGAWVNGGSASKPANPTQLPPPD